MKILGRGGKGEGGYGGGDGGVTRNESRTPYNSYKKFTIGNVHLYVNDLILKSVSTIGTTHSYRLEIVKRHLFV